METAILNGVQIAQQIRSEISAEVAKFRHETGTIPKLAAVLVGGDPASQVYVEHKRRGCQQVGMDSELVLLDQHTSADELLATIQRLNEDSSVHGILIQLPLPKHLPVATVLDAVDPAKDVDCFHPENVGLMVQGRPRFLPCTPHGVLQILFRSGIRTAGRRVCILGRSEIVGKPLAMMLVQKDGPFGAEWANATVTVLHSQSEDLVGHTRSADIVIAAIGQAQFLKRDMVRPGAVVIDVGINRVPAPPGAGKVKLVGDADYLELVGHVSAITPVPGGVGPLTVTMLLANTLASARDSAARRSVPSFAD
ncbi:MAG TPA: bifunctional 5,10-methylenetetrahydrofolate dehydrogenase/5,10-methenyltetrahydrofolate cyclohydrolase [Pirellulaceae bacterium]|nr:bifunctional 5,10-methylenetetrahydrofolate dehydrogenase/5,10-methenyltetrahydrofolate cyclohydrolase [Pirellulaceae bacterium]